MASEETPASLESSFDLESLFMTALGELLDKLRTLYPRCKRTGPHVDAFHAHRAEPGVAARSLSMWHRSMQPFYVDIAQSKDEERLRRALRAAVGKNWFFTEMRMPAKMANASFAPSLPSFTKAVRYLNGIAFMQNSFLGKLTEAFKELGPDVDPIASAPELASRVLKHLNADTFMEISRMLPHVIHVLGGVEQFDALLDQALSDKDSAMKPVFDQLLSSFMPDAPDADEALREGRGMVRDVLTRLADPDNEQSLLEVVGEIRGGEKMSREQLEEAFSSLRESFDESTIMDTLGALTSFAADHEGATFDEVQAAAREALASKGFTVSDEQVESMRKAAQAIVGASEGGDAADVVGAVTEAVSAVTGAGAGAGAPSA